uniref:REM-1 domain-containing protein n=1 Tax=Heterorhabditis bacteriophora TaxID=37862 RepID=A0A1I7X490_HETBA
MADVAPAAWMPSNNGSTSEPSTWDSVPSEVAQLADKYNFNIGDERSVQKEVIELKKRIRAAATKQMRIKAGYVQMQKATNGKKQLEYLKREVRDLSDQISEMQDDLQILDVYDTGAFACDLDTHFSLFDVSLWGISDVQFPWEPRRSVTQLAFDIHG